MYTGALVMQGTAEDPEDWDYVAFSQAIQALREAKVGECAASRHRGRKIERVRESEDAFDIQSLNPRILGVLLGDRYWWYPSIMCARVRTNKHI